MSTPQINRQYCTLNAWGTKPDRPSDENRCAFGHIYYRTASSVKSDVDSDFSDLYAGEGGGDFYVRSMEDMFDDFKDIYQVRRRRSILSIHDLDEEKDDQEHSREVGETKKSEDEVEGKFKDVIEDSTSTGADTTFNNDVHATIERVTTKTISQTSSQDSISITCPPNTSSNHCLAIPYRTSTSPNASVSIPCPSDKSSESSSTPLHLQTHTSSESNTSFSSTSRSSEMDISLSCQTCTASELSLLRVLDEIRSRIVAGEMKGAGDMVHDTDNTNAKTLHRSATNILNLAAIVPEDSITQVLWTHLFRLFEYQSNPHGEQLRHFQILQDYPEHLADDVISKAELDIPEEISLINSSESGKSIKLHTVGLSSEASSASTLGESFDSISFSVSERAIITKRFGAEEIEASGLFQNNDYTISATNSSFSVDTDTSGIGLLSGRRTTSRVQRWTESRILRFSAAMTLLYVAYLFHVHIIIAFLMDVFLTEDQMTVVGALLPIMGVTFLLYLTLFHKL